MVTLQHYLRWFLFPLGQSHLALRGEQVSEANKSSPFSGSSPTKTGGVNGAVVPWLKSWAPGMDSQTSAVFFYVFFVAIEPYKTL